MIRVKAEELQPGMVTARDVNNIDGMLLAPAGCELTERQISILQAWGVAEIAVEATEEQARTHDPLAQLPPETLARITDKLRVRFWNPDEFGPVAAEIFRILLLREARRLLDSQSP